MRRRLGFAFLVVLALAAPAHAARPTCALKGAQFIAKSSRGMLFWVAVKPRTAHRGKGKHRHKVRIVSAVKRRYYGCRFGHRPLLLTADVRPHARRATRYANSTFRIGGTWAGWVATTQIRTGRGRVTRAIHVRSLAGAKRSVDISTTGGWRTYGAVRALKVGSDGAVAFALAAQGGDVEIDGITKAATTPMTIAYAGGIRPGSVQLGRGAVTWRQNGRNRTARLARPRASPRGVAKGPQGLDGRFGDCGTLIPALVKASGAAALRLARAPDGELLAAGIATSGKGHPAVADTAVVTRFSVSGRFGHGFGTTGVVQTRLPRAAGARDSTLTGLVVQSDGKPVVSVDTRQARASETEPVLLRYTTAGKLDTSFGKGGIVRSAVPSTTSAAIADLALAPDGGLIAVGRRDDRWFVARFRANGKLDRAFGNAGVVADTGNRPSTARAVSVGFDGTIAVAGQVGASPLLVRLGADGTPIGRTTSAPPASAGLVALAPRPGGGWLAAGTASNLNDGDQLLIVGYTANGTLDKAFGASGFVIDPQVSGARHLVVEGDGSPLVSAAFDVGSAGAGDGLVHYTKAGRRDAGFGFRGALGATAGYGLINTDILLGLDGTGLVAQRNGGAFAVSRFALAGPVLQATAREPSVCAMLVSATKLGPLVAGRQLPVGLRLRRTGKLHLHATVTANGRTVTLGDSTTPRTTIEAAVATLRISNAAAKLMAQARKAKIVIRGGLPGGPVKRYSITVSR